MKLLMIAGFCLVLFIYPMVIQAQNDDQPVLKLPPSGTLDYLTDKEAVAPLKIVTRKPGNYYIKLEDVITKQTIQTIFVRGGQTIEVDVPLGSYVFKYAVGEKWYGEEYLFGTSTSYSKAEDVFDFKVIGNQISGYMIELYKQVSGNLDEEPISPEEFKR